MGTHDAGAMAPDAQSHQARSATVGAHRHGDLLQDDTGRFHLSEDARRAPGPFPPGGRERS